VWVAAIGAAGCGAPPAHIAQGDAFVTGSAPFDEFLTAVKYVRADGLSAQGDEASAHAGLIKALGLDAAAIPSQAVAEAGARAQKLRDKGVLLHLEIAPEPKLLSVKGRTELGADGEALLKAMEDAVRSSLDMRKRLAAVAARAAELEKKRVDLRAQVSAAFGQEPVKRDQVLVELDAAKTVLADASDAASRSAGAAARFVVELVQAVETGAVPEQGKAGFKDGRGKKGPAMTAGKGTVPKASAPVPQAPAAPAPPPKKAKGGDDFEP
jgi:hypothetical protein